MSNYEHRYRRSLVRRVWSLLTLGSVIVAAMTSPTFAVGTILSTGFESPFVPGQLQGQQGWTVSGGGTSTATVENSVVNSGSQALQVTKTAAANNDRRWAVPQTGFPTGGFVVVDWDMRVAQTVGNTGFGPFFGMEGYDADINPYVLGSLGVDATTGEVLYQMQGTGEILAGPVVNFNQWHHFRMVFDFVTDTYRGFVNGTQVANTGFVDGGFGLNDFTDADISAFAAGGDLASQTAGGNAWFDNLVVRDAPFGDYDVDGDVDAADFAIWRQTFSNTVSPAGNNADGNRNAKVDAADYVMWRNWLGTGVGAGSGVSASVVPEPASVGLLVVAGFGAATLSRRRVAV